MGCVCALRGSTSAACIWSCGVLLYWCFVMQVCSFRGDIIGACMLCWAPVVMFVECMNLSQLRHPSGMLTKMNEQKL